MQKLINKIILRISNYSQRYQITTTELWKLIESFLKNRM